LDEINLPENLKQDLRNLEFKSLYNDLQSKKFNYKDITILNILKTIYNLNNINVINEIQKISNTYKKNEDIQEEDLSLEELTKENIENMKLNKNLNIKEKENNENFINNININKTTAIDSYKSFDYIQSDNDLTLSDYSN